MSVASSAEETDVRATIGELAKVALSPRGPEAPGLLRGGLTNPSPQVRAAAARVGHTVGARGLLPDLRAALAKEDQKEPAREMAWPLAGGEAG